MRLYVFDVYYQIWNNFFIICSLHSFLYLSTIQTDTKSNCNVDNSVCFEWNHIFCFYVNLVNIFCLQARLLFIGIYSVHKYSHTAAFCHRRGHVTALMTPVVKQISNPNDYPMLVKVVYKWGKFIKIGLYVYNFKIFCNTAEITAQDVIVGAACVYLEPHLQRNIVLRTRRFRRTDHRGFLSLYLSYRESHHSSTDILKFH